jgi:serine/threonine-protein kinase
LNNPVSPDGTRLVFPVGEIGASGLAVRLLGQPNATPLVGTESGVNPFFSPDGEWVAFGAGGKLKKTPIRGGPPVTLCDGGNFHGGSWGEDGFIVASFGNSAGLSRVPEGGGPPQPLTKPEHGEITHRFPQTLPGGKAVLFSASNSQVNWEEATVEVLSLKTGQRKTVQRGGFFGRYLPSGYLVYVRGGSLYGVPFDIDGLEAKGPPATLLEDVAASSYGGGQLDFSRNGTLVYLSGKASAPARTLVWIEADGKMQPLFAAPDRFSAVSLSPDGKRLAASIGSAGASELWIYDLQREISTKLLSAGKALGGAAWAPDGKHLVYGGELGKDSGLIWIRADSGGERQVLVRDETGFGRVAQSVSPDGRHVVFNGPLTGLLGLTIDTSDPDHPKAGAPETLLKMPGPRGAAISPDGHWLAYTSTDTAVGQVFVRPFADGKIAGSSVWPISAAGGLQAVWSKAARQLLYVTADNHVMVVDYTVEADVFHAMKPRAWTDKQIGQPADTSTPFRTFDLTPDGKRIIALAPDEGSKGARVNLHVTLLANWFDEVRRRLPVSGN